MNFQFRHERPNGPATSQNKFLRRVGALVCDDGHLRRSGLPLHHRLVETELRSMFLHAHHSALTVFYCKEASHLLSGKGQPSLFGCAERLRDPQEERSLSSGARAEDNVKEWQCLLALRDPNETNPQRHKEHHTVCHSRGFLSPAAAS